MDILLVFVVCFGVVQVLLLATGLDMADGSWYQVNPVDLVSISRALVDLEGWFGPNLHVTHSTCITG